MASYEQIFENNKKWELNWNNRSSEIGVTKLDRRKYSKSASLAKKASKAKKVNKKKK